MKAIRVHATGGPEVLRLEELPDPTPGAGQIVIRVEAAGVNFIDVYHRKGLYPVPLPFTPGREAAGRRRAGRRGRHYLPRPETGWRPRA